MHLSTQTPPCLSCKRRRVKCDYTKPSCERCKRDYIECPGYTKRAKFIHFSPPHSQAELDDSRSKSLWWNSQHRGSSPHLTPLSHPDKDCSVLLESIRCYNTYMVPQLIPAHPPFNRPEFNAVYWDEMPKLLQYPIIVMVGMAHRNGVRAGSLSQVELYHYKGLALAEITNALPEALNDPYGIILSAILLMMLNEIQYASSPAWTSHLEAASSIITQRGGIANCFETIPGIRRLLVIYMALETFGATMRHHCSLDLYSVKKQYEFIPIWSKYEQDSIATGYACPQIIFQAVIQTNYLRFLAVSSCKGNNEANELHPLGFDAILRLIETFDTAAWASKVRGYGRTHPTSWSDIEDELTSFPAWTALALCYQQAALLYLILTCHASSAEHTKAQLDVRVQAAKHSLSEQIRFIFDIASDNNDDPIQT